MRLDCCWKWMRWKCTLRHILLQSAQRCPRDNESIATLAEQSTTLTTPTTFAHRAACNALPARNADTTQSVHACNNYAGKATATVDVAVASGIFHSPGNRHFGIWRQLRLLDVRQQVWFCVWLFLYICLFVPFWLRQQLIAGGGAAFAVFVAAAAAAIVAVFAADAVSVVV